MAIDLSQLFKEIEYGDFDYGDFDCCLDNIKTMIELREQQIAKEKENAKR